MRYLNYVLGCLPLVAGSRARHNKLFTSQPGFADHPFPTIPIDCPELGPTGTYLDKDHTSEGAGFFPALSWPSSTEHVEEYLLVSEDPDVPIADSVIHGIYYGIPRAFTGVQDPDFRLPKKHDDPYLLRGGFKYGENRHGEGTVYLPPSPIIGSGPHRYFFELIALNETIDQEHLSDLATLEEIREEVQGKVAGWGEWVGVFERK